MNKCTIIRRQILKHQPRTLTSCPSPEQEAAAVVAVTGPKVSVKFSELTLETGCDLLGDDLKKVPTAADRRGNRSQGSGGSSLNAKARIPPQPSTLQ